MTDETKDVVDEGGTRSFKHEDVEELKKPEAIKDDVKKDIEPVAKIEPTKDKIEEKVEIKEPVNEEKVDAEYETLKAEAAAAKKQLAERDATKEAVDKQMLDLKTKIVEDLGFGKKETAPEDLDALDTEEKLYEHLQKKGYTGFKNLLLAEGDKRAKTMVSSILNDLAGTSALYAEYPDLKDENSDFSKKVAETVKKEGLSPDLKGRRLAAKLTKYELGIDKAADVVKEAIDDAGKGIDTKADATHVEVSTKGIPAKPKGLKLNAEQKDFIRKSGMKEEDYKSMAATEKDVYGRKTYSRE